MQNIEKYLVNLMHQHDCVVIPNFGGLVANYTPGFADAKSNLLHPPKKGFVWNKFLQHNDGLLAHEICKEEGVAYDSAVNQLNSFVIDCKRQLSLTKRLDFGLIGSFFLSEEKTMSFIPSKDNYLLSSFGLPIVRAMAIHPLEKVTAVINLPREKEVEKIPEVEVKKPMAKVIEIKESTKVIEKRKVVNSKWWIAAALIPIGFYSAWIPMKTDMLKGNGNFQYSDLNPFSFQKTAGMYSEFDLDIPKIDSLVKVDFAVLDNKISEVNSITKNDYVETPESTYVDTVVPEINYSSSEEKAYFVIGGCFADKINAETFVNDLKSKGFDAQLVDFHKGLHRVAFGSYVSRDAAKSAKSDITSGGEYSAWVLKK